MASSNSTTPPTKVNYVDKVQFLNALRDYKKAVRIAKRQGQPKPKIPDYVGECILKMTTKIASRPNFSNYIFREDMEGDAIENCLLYLDNFDPNNIKGNPFGYFSKIIWYAFLRRIAKEKKQYYIKFKSIQNSSLFEASSRQTHDKGVYDNTFVKFIQENMSGIIEEFEAKKDEKMAKSKSKKKQGLDKFLED